jgi:uncharacterized protein
VAVFLWISTSHSLLAAPQFPSLTGRVVDDAEVLSPTTQAQVLTWLEDFERTSGRQVVVATVKSLQGYPIEDYGYQLGRAWGIGDKQRNTGAILLVAPNDRSVRIEVGYGLEGELTDAVSRRIIEQDILPAFRQGNYEQGVTAGTVAMLRALGWKGSGPAASSQDTSGTDYSPLVFLAIIMLFFFFGHGRRAIWLLPLMGRGVWGSRSRGGFSGGGGSFGGGGASGRW